MSNLIIKVLNKKIPGKYFFLLPFLFVSIIEIGLIFTDFELAMELLPLLFLTATAYLIIFILTTCFVFSQVKKITTKTALNPQLVTLLLIIDIACLLIWSPKFIFNYVNFIISEDILIVILVSLLSAN